MSSQPAPASPSVAISEPQAPSPNPSHRCRFAFADGRTCRMLRCKSHPDFCLPHAREEFRLLAIDRLAEELTTISGKFNTAGDVNHVLGKVLALRLSNKISRRDAALYGFIGQLLLQSLRGVREEIIAARGVGAWRETIAAVYQHVPVSAPGDLHDQKIGDAHAAASDADFQQASVGENT